MGLLKMAVVGGAGYGLYKYLQRERHEGRVAFASGETAHHGGVSQVRNAGPESMRSNLKDWDKAYEASDESFPASDPPANY